MQVQQQFRIAVTAIALAGCGARVDAPSVVVPRTEVAPLLDAHQHMMSPAAMSLLVREPSPPAITVPAELAELLRARANGVTQPNYAVLFADDALVYAEEQGRWWTGRARILDALDNFGSGYRFVPARYALDGAAGYVAGVLRSENGADTHNFILGLQKSADGRWRIVAEMKQSIAPPTYAPVIDAKRIIKQLDDAGIRYATVLSVAYWYGDPEKNVHDRAAKTRAENDWVIAESARYADRLIPFCGVNPVDDYALAELERCAALGVRGMKIHRNSKFDPANQQQREKLRQFFRAANQHKLAIVIHLRGAPQDYIDHVFPAAPDIPIQIAHMASGWDNLQVFANAIAAGKPGTPNLWFDWTQAMPIEDLWTHGRPGGLGGAVSAEEKAEVVALMRRVGIGRILFGSDMPLSWNPTPREWWRKTVLTLPLTDAELRDIADNLPPYVPVANSK